MQQLCTAHNSQTVNNAWGQKLTHKVLQLKHLLKASSEAALSKTWFKVQKVCSLVHWGGGPNFVDMLKGFHIDAELFR